MGNRAGLAAVFPSILRHEGRCTGTYTYLNETAAVIDQHTAEVTCEFPDTGPTFYVQHNRFRWTDGRESVAKFERELRGDRLWWDATTLRGWAWETREGLILLDLERKDDPGARFYRIIVTAPDGQTRARTWHWFRQGRLFKRTLCDEMRV